MKWFRAMPCSNTVPNPLVCEIDNFDKYDNFGFGFRVERYFYQTEWITNWLEDISFTTNKEMNNGEPDDVLQTARPIPIFSQRLVHQLLAKDFRGFQYLPITVLDLNRNKVSTFYIANCLNYQDAFDYEKSNYSRFPMDFPNEEARGKIICQTVVLRKSGLIDNQQPLRLKEYPYPLFVPDTFVRIFKENHFTGYSFLAVRTH